MLVSSAINSSLNLAALFKKHIEQIAKCVARSRQIHTHTMEDSI